MAAAAGSVKKHDPREPFEDMNFELVHCVGKVRNDEILEDDDFKIQAEDSYRMWRSVEMYQWQEHKRTREIRERDSEGNETVRHEVYYVHDLGWYSYPINSRNFHERQDHENPDNQWPFRGHSWHARRLDMENMKLDINRALDKLGKSSDNISLGQFEEIASYETEE